MSPQYDPHKHHRRSIRLKGWDYGRSGLYFVTICTHDRKNIFADQQLYDIAEMAWLYIPQQKHAKHVVLDERVIMPNHKHGILGLSVQEGVRNLSNTLQPGSVGAIVGNYKMLVTKRVKAMLKMADSDFQVWQRGYYERIIRNERELNAIRHYIQQNPIRWAEDRENLDGLLAKMTYIDSP